MQRTTMVAVAVFGVLLLAAGYVLTRKPEHGIVRVSYAGLQTSTLDRIVISGAHAVEMKKDGAVWRLSNGRQADADMVKNLLATATRISTSDVITEDPNRAAEFQTDAAQGEHIQLYALGTQMADFVVGKPQGSGVALRTGDITFRANNVFAGAFVHTPAEWQERKLFPERLDDIRRVTLRLHGDAPYTVAMAAEKGWELAMDANTEAQLPADYRFDSAAGQALVGAVANLRAQDILDKDPGVETTKLGPDADVITVWLRDNAIATDPNTGSKQSNRVIRLGATAVEGDKLVYAQVEGRSDVFMLPTYGAAAVRKKVTDLRDLTIMQPFDVNAVQAVTVNDGKKAVTFSKDGDTWRLPKGEKTPVGFQLDPMKVVRRIQSVAHARALGISTAQPRAAGLVPAKQSLSLNLDGKSTVTVPFGNKATEQDNAVYTLGTDGKVYYIATYLRDTLLGGIDSFKKDAQQADALSQLDPKALAGLPPDVRASLEQQIAQKKREQQMLQAINKGQAPHP